MITAKFGGTAITPRNLIYVKRIITPAHKRIVVSAVGKESPNDVKTTDLLERYYIDGDEKYWDKIADKYRRLVSVNAIDADADEILYDAKSRARKFSRAYCMSLGEEISAKLVAAFLGFTYVEADSIVRFNSRGLAYKKTIAQMSKAFEGVDSIVTGGYYGMGKYGRQTFSRGGSDVTGALCAVASDSTLYENWTDVNGVCAANPALVSNVYTLPALSYAQMRQLSYAGAEVLHPDAVLPVERAGIPVKIGNFFNPDGSATLVGYCRADDAVLSVAEKRRNGYFVTTVLHSMPLALILKVLAEYMENNLCTVNIADCNLCRDKVSLSEIKLNENTVIITTKVSVIKGLCKYFQSANCLG